LGQYITLTKFIEEHKKWDVQSLIMVIENIKHGLLTIHQLGIAHRDIKPDNIMINPTTFDIKYIDFGLSCQLKGCFLIEGGGTRLYTAPETLLHGGEHLLKSPRSLKDWIYADYWSVGLVLIEVLVGSHLYDLVGNTHVETNDVLMRVLLNLIKNGGIDPMIIGERCSQIAPSDMITYAHIDTSIRSLLRPKPSSRELLIKDKTSLKLNKVSLNLVF
jgi:serine/threonine protein kinase